DFLIDGRSLYDAINNDLISPFGWMPVRPTSEAIERLMLRNGPDLPENRYSLYICPECGDLGCGAFSAEIERGDTGIVWRDFGHQNNYDGEVRLDPYKDFGPFCFDATAYVRVLESLRPEARHDQ
ncbi:MAG TPA: hypothetical protein VL501_06035, partial [Pyrinomonadaceae bacterium]|nr:hypothetical protein [Pyrinomonadaceae bacterium]